MLSSRPVILAEPIGQNMQQMLPLIYTHIYICTNPYY